MIERNLVKGFMFFADRVGSLVLEIYCFFVFGFYLV